VEGLVQEFCSLASKHKLQIHNRSPHKGSRNPGRKPDVLSILSNSWKEKMKWSKPPEGLVAFLAAAMKDVDCEYRKMFGYPAYFLHGNMFIGAFQDRLFLRLSKADRERLMTLHQEVIPFEPMPGRVMQEYVVIPESLYIKKEFFEEWLGKSILYTSSLLPKKKKNRE
jgi:TfoX/Sxy family transcriptional regulator of competence genes